jgi:hypothetical protein
MVNLNLNLWVLLAILAMIACGILGLVVGIDHVGPGQALRAEQEGTRNAVNVRATEAVLAATQTPQAIYVGMAADEARMTAYPVSLTATRAAEAVNAQYEQATATQNARNEDERNPGLDPPADDRQCQCLQRHPHGNGRTSTSAGKSR